jgi:6-phosphogluconolactonase
MIRSLLATAAALITSVASAGDHYFVYFGTNTNAKNGSEGIYVARFNSANGELTKPELAAKAGNPGFLAIHPSRKFLFAIGDVTGADGKKGGGISAFSIDGSSGHLTLLNQSSAVGSGPCHVNVDATGRMAVLANYGSGSVASYSIASDGKLSAPVSFIQHEGSSINPKRQSGPHAHSVNFSPDNRFAFACDLGLDKVLIYKVSPQTGELVPNEPAFAKTPEGGGPRHLAFHPSGKYVFVNNEMAMTETSSDFPSAFSKHPPPSSREPGR